MLKVHTSDKCINFEYSKYINTSDTISILKEIHNYLVDYNKDYVNTTDLWRRMYVAPEYAAKLNTCLIEKNAFIHINPDYYQSLIGFWIKEINILEEGHILVYKEPKDINNK